MEKFTIAIPTSVKEHALTLDHIEKQPDQSYKLTSLRGDGVVLILHDAIEVEIAENPNGIPAEEIKQGLISDIKTMTV